MSDAYTIKISVDSSRARAGLDDLRRSIQGTSRDLQSLGANTPGFSQLASQLNTTSGGFTRLSRSMASLSSASRSIANASTSFSGFAAGAKSAHGAVAQLASAINPLHAGIAALSTLVGGLSLSHFSKSILETGNSVLSFKLALDSVATDSGEANRMFDYIASASNRMGVSLESNLETFKNLRVSMASLGIDTGRTQALFENFGKSFAALHTSAAHVRRAWYDIQEVFALDRLDAQRVRAISTHLPGFVGALQQSLGKVDLHEAFKKGIPSSQIEEVGKILGNQYSKAQEQALNHSQANLAILGNKFTEFRAQVFDEGFDSGLTNFLKEMNAALDGAGFKNFGAIVGEGFRKAFAAATIFGKAILDLRDPLAEVLKTLGLFALATVGIGAVGAAFTLLASPLGALAALATIVATQWDTLTATFRKAALGAVESYALIQGLVSGKGWDESKHLAAVAGGEYLQKQAGSQAGENYAESFLARVKNLFSSVPGLNLDKYNADYERILKNSTPHDFQGASDYQTNNARRDEILLRQAEHAAELSNKLKSLREQLLPTTASFDRLREVLEKIESMRGKKIGDHAIADSELNRMRDAAKESAFNSAFPAASHIRDLTDNLRIEQEAMRAGGGNVELMKEEKAYLQERLALKRKGVDLTNEESAALRSLIHEQAALNKRDGFRSWAESQKTGMESINASVEHGLDATADALARIATEGGNIKKVFSDLLRSIASDLIRNGVRSMMAEGIKGLQGQLGAGSASLTSALGLGDSVVSKAQSAVDDAAKSLASTTTPLMEVTASVVNISGVGGIGASGTEAFRPSADIGKAVNPASVGGITPTNAATAPLFKNDNAIGQLPGFKDAISLTGAQATKTGLGAIPSNSAALFGAGLSGRQSLGDIGGTLKAIPDFKLSGPETVAAFGKNLQKLAPVAERAGVTPISGSLEAMYKRAGLDKVTEGNLRGIHPDLQRTFLRAKEISGQNFTMNHGQGLRSQAEANANAARGLGIRNSQHLEGTAGDVNLYRNGRYIANGADPAYRQFNGAMQQAAKEYGLPVKWGGDFRDYDHWQLPRGWKGAHKQAGIDPTPTGSINATQKLADQSKRAQQALEAQTAATKKIEDATKQASQVTSQMSQPLQSFDGGLSNLSQNLTAGVPATESFTSEIEKMIQKLMSGLGGGGGGLGGLASEGASLLGGLFSEGGYSGSPVSSASMPASFWAGAPHYAEGTPNTSGGMPAILHDNEAVVPLSRGRSIPVEINGAGGQTVINNHNHVTTNVQGVNDFHSFRRSKGQLMSAMQREAGRLAARNN